MSNSNPSRTPSKQRTANEDRNADFFDGWGEYHDMVGSLDTYANSARALDSELAGRVVDVGSGGVVNYDCAAISELVLVDLSDVKQAGASWPACARPVLGSAVELPLETGGYDCVLMQMVVHHLAERDFATTRERVAQAFREAQRVLRPGGRLVILESVMPGVLEWAERWAFPLTRRILAGMGHPLVFQWRAGTLAKMAGQAGFSEVSITPVPRGRWMIFLGRRMPTMLVPVRFAKIVATKA
ncbi:MAG: methyltransferase domain-containing protein [Verrucomicrobia bacterium]|nr:methyltransferase domain-containing protein [Verrucomicrobiota bacterium]